MKDFPECLNRLGCMRDMIKEHSFGNTGLIEWGKQTLSLSVCMATKALCLSVHMDVCYD